MSSISKEFIGLCKLHALPSYVHLVLVGSYLLKSLPCLLFVKDLKLFFFPSKNYLFIWTRLSLLNNEL